jgi:hypothetical protein
LGDLIIIIKIIIIIRNGAKTLIGGGNPSTGENHRPVASH